MIIEPVNLVCEERTESTYLTLYEPKDNERLILELLITFSSLLSILNISLIHSLSVSFSLFPNHVSLP